MCGAKKREIYSRKLESAEFSVKDTHKAGKTWCVVEGSRDSKLYRIKATLYRPSSQSIMLLFFAFFFLWSLVLLLFLRSRVSFIVDCKIISPREPLHTVCIDTMIQARLISNQRLVASGEAISPLEKVHMKDLEGSVCGEEIFPPWNLQELGMNRYYTRYLDNFWGYEKEFT